MDLTDDCRKLAAQSEHYAKLAESNGQRCENLEKTRQEMEDDLEKLVNENEKLEVLLGDREDELESLRTEYQEIEDKIVNEMQTKVNMLINENDRLGATLDCRNDELSEWKRKYDELEGASSRRIQENEGELYRLKSDLSRLDAAMKQRENRLSELEEFVRDQDRKIKVSQEDLYIEKRTTEDQRSKISLLEPELENTISIKKRLDAELAELRKLYHNSEKKLADSEKENYD
jgi:chromosome segregation ATPase